MRRACSLLLAVLYTLLLSQAASSSANPVITRRDLMPSIKAMHPEIKCDACLTTVERFMAMWKQITSKIEKEEGDRNKDLRAGKDGPRMNINDNVTHSVATMCIQGATAYEGKLDGFALPAYLEEACKDMVGSEFEHGPLRFKLHKNFIGQTWIDMPRIKKDVCEDHREAMCAKGEAAAPIALPELGDQFGRRCSDCQEVVSDLHFAARRLRLDKWQRKQHLETSLEKVCFAVDMRHQTPESRDSLQKREACEELRDLLQDEHTAAAEEYFATFGAWTEASWAAGGPTAIRPLAEATAAICVEATGMCAKPKKKKTKKKSKGKAKGKKEL